MHTDKASEPMGQVKDAPILQPLYKQRKLNILIYSQAYHIKMIGHDIPIVNNEHTTSVLQTIMIP
jgi:hypothetical protein